MDLDNDMDFEVVVVQGMKNFVMRVVKAVKLVKLVKVVKVMKVIKVTLMTTKISPMNRLTKN